MVINKLQFYTFILKYLACLGFLCLLGCATTATTRITSSPEGVTVSVDNKYVGETPITIKVLDRWTSYDTYTVEARMLGYQDDVKLFKEVGFFGNANTAMPTHIHFILKPEQGSSSHQKTSPDISQKSAKLYSSQANSFTHNWAVVIGISKYQHSGQSGLTNLIFADDDAKAFARSLHNLGWSDSHFKLLTNEEATEKNVRIALESWLTKAGPNDQIILFWAGHGFPDPEDPEKIYFATYDTDISIPATGYRMDRVRSALEEIGSRNVVLLADTCHAGKLITRGDGSRGISIVPNINKMKREKSIPKGWIFMVGADTDRQAIEHTSWTNGAFTHSLIKGLSGEADGFQSAGAKDGVVTMGELKDYMNISMPDETQKVLGVAKRPVITTSTGDPDIWNLTLQVKQ